MTNNRSIYSNTLVTQVTQSIGYVFMFENTLLLQILHNDAPQHYLDQVQRSRSQVKFQGNGRKTSAQQLLRWMSMTRKKI